MGTDRIEGEHSFHVWRTSECEVCQSDPPHPRHYKHKKPRVWGVLTGLHIQQVTSLCQCDRPTLLSIGLFQNYNIIQTQRAHIHCWHSVLEFSITPLVCTTTTLLSIAVMLNNAHWFPPKAFGKTRRRKIMHSANWRWAFTLKIKQSKSLIPPWLFFWDTDKASVMKQHQVTAKNNSL